MGLSRAKSYFIKIRGPWTLPTSHKIRAWNYVMERGEGQEKVAKVGEMKEERWGEG